MTTGRINQVAFVAVPRAGLLPASRNRPHEQRTERLPAAVAGKAFLNETTCLPTPSNLLGRQSHKVSLYDPGKRRILLLGRENVLRCELTDGHNGVSRSGTRRARVLLLLAFGIAYSYNRFVFSAQARICLRMSHPSQRFAGTRHRYPRASA